MTVQEPRHTEQPVSWDAGHKRRWRVKAVWCDAHCHRQQPAEWCVESGLPSLWDRHRQSAVSWVWAGLPQILQHTDWHGRWGGRPSRHQHNDNDNDDNNNNSNWLILITVMMMMIITIIITMLIVITVIMMMIIDCMFQHSGVCGSSPVSPGWHALSVTMRAWH